MIYRLILSVLFLFSFEILQAQDTKCVFDQVPDLFPSAQKINYQRQLQSIEKQIASQLATTRNQNNLPRYFPNGPEYIIPVVVHVINNGEAYGVGTNISYAQILSQIDALNAGFSNYNPSANYYQTGVGLQYNSNTRGAHAVDTKIRFCLATAASAGVSWTNISEPGVMRYADGAASHHEFSIAGQTQLLNLTQSSNAFPSSDYLNIWVVQSIRFGGPANSGDCPGIQGYATIAGYLDNSARLIEGVVIRSDVFGDNSVNGNSFDLQPNTNVACNLGLNPSIANRGKIAVHEVGHYLGLFHTFQDCLTSTADCYGTGDLICDTNPCDAPNTNQVCGVTDMPENFMYYSDDNVLNTFTQDQSDRMQAMLASVRATLVSETNVLASGVLGPDGCFSPAVIAEFTHPDIFCTGDVAVFSNVNNLNGGNLASQWQWAVSPVTGVNISDASSSTTSISFTEAGIYTVQLIASNPGSVSDTVIKTISVIACQLDPCRKDQLHWIFGWGYLGVDFSNGIPVAVNPPSPLMISDGNQESYVTQSDPETGDLLFYTNGFHVYNASGNRITSSPLYPIGPSDNSNAQIACVPYPRHNKQYLLIIPTRGWDSPPITSVAADYPAAKIYLVDMNGTGVVSAFSCDIVVTAPAGETVNFNQFAYSEDITVIPHKNGIDYWIVLPVRMISGRIYMASFLVNAAGVSQNNLTSMNVSGYVLGYGSGIVASPSHQNIACKYMNAAFNISMFTASFNNLTGIFSTPQLYNLNALNLPNAGGIIFFDEDHIWFSKTTGSPNGIVELSLSDGITQTVGSARAFGRPERGPDNNIYVLERTNNGGPGSNQLCRIDKVSGVMNISTVIPASVLSANVVSPNGVNFWNLPNNFYCEPDQTILDFDITRTSCNSFDFHVAQDSLWQGYFVDWNFGDGTVVTAVPVTQVLNHSYANAGSFDVTISVHAQLTGCAGNFSVSSGPLVKTVQAIQGNNAVSIEGPSSVCLSSNLHELIYQTYSDSTAAYTWTLTGGGYILQPSNGVGVDHVTIDLGITAGPRTLTVNINNNGCVSEATIVIDIHEPGPGNAGLDGNLNVCKNDFTTIELFDIIVNEQPGGTWVRTNGSGGNFEQSPGRFTPDALTTNSSFQYLISASGCSTADTSLVNINFINSPYAGADSIVSFCTTSGQSFNLNDYLAGSTNGGEWTQITGSNVNLNSLTGIFLAGSGGGNYAFEYVVQGSNGCSNDTAIVSFALVKQANAGEGSSATVCDLNTAIQLSSFLNNQDANGSWIQVSGNSLGFNNAAGTYIPGVSGTSEFAYIINGQNICSNDTSRVYLVAGSGGQHQQVEAKICDDKTQNLFSLVDTSGLGSALVWTIGGTAVSNPESISTTGVYDLIVGNPGGCEDTISVNLIFLPPVQANAFADSIVVTGVPFYLHGSGGQNYHWNWDPFNAVVSDANSPNPLVVLSAPQYEFILEVSDANGCKGFDTIQIKVFKGPAFYLPNAFSPNDDGLNDLFTPLPAGIRKLNFFRIYNRFGELIFETSRLGEGWDGKFKGKLQDTGSFVWMIQGVANSGARIDLKGTVILIK